MVQISRVREVSERSSVKRRQVGEPRPVSQHPDKLIMIRSFAIYLAKPDPVSTSLPRWSVCQYTRLDHGENTPSCRRRSELKMNTGISCIYLFHDETFPPVGLNVDEQSSFFYLQYIIHSSESVLPARRCISCIGNKHFLYYTPGGLILS